MACSVNISDFEALLPQAADSICTKLTKLIRYARLIPVWLRCHFTEDGELSQEAINRLCSQDCIGGGGGQTTPAGNPASFDNMEVFDCESFEQEWTVPAGAEGDILIEVWGGGGGGGSGGGTHNVTCPAVYGLNTGSGGGGGGSGGYTTRLTGVTPGEVLRVLAGNGGAAGNGVGCFGGFSGTSGVSSYVKRFAGSLIVAATGGSGGGGGNVSSTDPPPPGVGGSGGSPTGEAGADGEEYNGGAGGAIPLSSWDNSGGSGGHGQIAGAAFSSRAGVAGNCGRVIIYWNGEATTSP